MYVLYEIRVAHHFQYFCNAECTASLTYLSNKVDETLNWKKKKKNQIKIKLKLTNVQPANRKCNVSCWDLSFFGLGYVNYIETINWNSQ